MIPQRLPAMLWAQADEVFWLAYAAEAPEVGAVFRAEAASVYSAGAVAAETFVAGAQATEVIP